MPPRVISGAEIEIAGDAGDYLAAPLAGELSGMAGRVIIRGSVGSRAGDRLRRGVIVIEGSSGEDFGVETDRWHDRRTGETLGRVGYLNKRGSLILAQCKDFGPTYLDCGAHQLTYIGLLSRSSASVSSSAARLLSGKLRRYGGDTSVYGKGEILTPMEG